MFHQLPSLYLEVPWNCNIQTNWVGPKQIRGRLLPTLIRMVLKTVAVRNSSIGLSNDWWCWVLKFGPTVKGASLWSVVSFILSLWWSVVGLFCPVRPDVSSSIYDNVSQHYRGGHCVSINYLPCIKCAKRWRIAVSEYLFIVEIESKLRLY